MKNHTFLTAILATSLVAPCLSQAQPAKPASELQSRLQAEELLAASLDMNHPPALPAGASSVLVIPKEPADPKSLAETVEDLNVMARILGKAATGETEQHSAMGIAIRNSLFGSSASPQNLYLEGYGALFLLDVNYPLVPPPAKAAESEPKDSTSSEWDEARRELYEPSTPGFTFNLPQSIPFMGKAEQYDADKVERLKTDLIAAFKNAAHIRRLKPDESVTVVVIGRSSSSTADNVAYSARYGMKTTRSIRIQSDSRRSELILRAKRSDIEAFQKDQLKLDEFRKRVSVMLH